MGMDEAEVIGGIKRREGWMAVRKWVRRKWGVRRMALLCWNMLHDTVFALWRYDIYSICDNSHTTLCGSISLQGMVGRL